MMIEKKHLDKLKQLIKGDVLSDYKSRNIYSTDASAYQELPQAVLIPRDERDVELIVGYAHQHKLPIIPRAAGTSLAGQVVGNGLVVDVSKHLNRILKLNIEERWVEVEPGVVLDELNLYLKPHNLFFGPETSTSNRCNIGGMVGNNSCGSRSLVYGSTRDHLLAVEGFLSNGQRVCFGELDVQAFMLKLKSESLEGDIYRKFNELLGDPKARHFIKNEFPHEDIKRRNTGYAVDLLVDMKPWGSGKNFNMCSLIAGSEGTLMFITKIRLALKPLPPPNYGLLCVHFLSLADAFNANLLALKFKPTAVELMDKTILDLTRENITQRKNRFFVDGDPEALLLVELNDASIEAVSERAGKLVNCLKENGLGYAYPLLFNSDIAKVWALRKAGLGVLSNMPGNDLPVPVIEDTAVRVDDLNLYLSDIGKMLLNNGKSCVYYGHIGSGELHLRPV
jgi:FAD/FMN-containing dehydrogenase